MNEFSRIVEIDQWDGRRKSLSYEANAGELAALAKRFDQPRVWHLKMNASLERTRDGFRLEGDLTAQMQQLCSLSMEPFDRNVDVVLDLLFVSDITTVDPELDGDDLDGPDIVEFSGHELDIGEAAAQSLSLALEPYPRKPGISITHPSLVDESTDKAQRSPFQMLKKIPDEG